MRWQSCDEANVVLRPQILGLFALILFTQNTYILTEKERPKFLNKRSHVVYEKISENALFKNTCNSHQVLILLFQYPYMCLIVLP